MAVVKSVRRGRGVYHYLVQTFRWEGRIRKKEVYLGTTIPPSLNRPRELLEREIWRDTWFKLFDRIKDGYRKRLRIVPRSVQEQDRNEFIIDFTYNTNRIEGSSLTFEETRKLLTRGVSPSSKPYQDVVESQKHATLLRRLMTEPEPIDLAHVLKWHNELFTETKPDIAGRLRDYEVRIANSRHVPPPALEVRSRLIELLRRTGRNRGELHPVQLAGEFHCWFEDIHPFGDGNGRVGRLAMNVLLARSGFPMLDIAYDRRAGYYSSLEEASVQNAPRRFLRWFFLRYSRDNRFYLGPG